LSGFGFICDKLNHNGHNFSSELHVSIGVILVTFPLHGSIKKELAQDLLLPTIQGYKSLRL
jgi:hypothetical protein